ncbi:phosphatidylinositol-3-phosphatase SAC1-like isoform X2 [Zingiber officinale]|uniref:phosphatidylinositol-3-phosphatase SAC1-like isoform X2 n=1 Tax=Zingiber officinale TaxID=94328 RepID=UPI001C4BAF60|nr:phosphatidylinositol-3-phosphatase SAC1-like isoform X2 [Zingiber officinale]
MAKRPPTPPLPVTSPPPGDQDFDQDLDPDSCSLEKFRLYETRARFYLIGSDRDKRFFRVLKIDRCEPSELNISEDPVVYSPQEVKSLLQRISEGNRATGGLSFFGKVYGIAGCIKFLESYYLILVTKRRQIGSICGHAIYCIDESQMITVPHSSIQSDVAHSKTELRYKKLLSSVDLTKDFFYSYTYPLMQSLQTNVLEINTEKMPYENMFVWNAYLTQAIRSRCNNTRWTIALIHGHFKQIKLSIFGREFSVILISRRSRHFAGTRGVNDCGRVANDVEIEQIVLDEEAGSCSGKMSSVVQMRGSIPLFWSQEASRFSPKPDIVLQRYDPTYQSTKLHFEDLAKRYGNPIIVLNLIKTFEKRPREMMLRREFANAVGYLNQILPEESQLKFIHWDFHKFAKSKSANVLAVLGAVASEALDLTGFYYSGKPIIARKKSAQISRTSTGRDASIGDLRASSGDLARMASNLEALNTMVFPDREKKLNQKLQILGGPRFQSGVLRTNCIDCLDRTNVAQYAYGLAALGRQLQALGLSDVPKIDADSSIAAALMDMYQSMGDALAQQYGGSAAHNTVFPERQGKWNATTQSREFLKSIRRYYSNAYTDGEKQDAINLFLGYFQPKDGKPALWELETDYYLHVAGIGDEVVPDSDRSLPFDTTHLSGLQSTLVPIPAYKRDFLRIKLTSFDKLMEQTCSSLMNVSLYKESDVKANAIAGSSGMAPDAAEIQLKSPNWLFGHRKYEENMPASKVTVNEMENGKPEDDFCAAGYDSLNWLSHIDDVCEEDIFKKYHAVTSVDEDDNWYGGNLIYDQDENSEAYKHYAMLCQGAVMDPFEHDPEKERHYAEALSLSFDNMNDTEIEVEMLAYLNEYAQIGADLGIVSSFKGLAEDPSQLTRWIIGEEKIEGWKK